MSKANKMFKELGYGLTYSVVNDKILYEKEYEIHKEYYGVLFNYKYKTYKKHVGYNGSEITPTEHLAIHEKMKELGWLDE